jgi:hypothetical protein
VITDHRFVGLRQDGIYGSPLAACQVEGCGQPKSQHAESCPGALTIRGEHFPCDMMAPHDGWGHSNKEAEAVWT